MGALLRNKTNLFAGDNTSLYNIEKEKTEDDIVALLMAVASRNQITEATCHNIRSMIRVCFDILERDMHAPVSLPHSWYDIEFSKRPATSNSRSSVQNAVDQGNLPETSKEFSIHLEHKRFEDSSLKDTPVRSLKISLTSGKTLIMPQRSKLRLCRSAFTGSVLERCTRVCLKAESFMYGNLRTITSLRFCKKKSQPKLQHISTRNEVEMTGGRFSKDYLESEVWNSRLINANSRHSGQGSAATACALVAEQGCGGSNVLHSVGFSHAEPSTHAGCKREPASTASASDHPLVSGLGDACALGPRAAGGQTNAASEFTQHETRQKLQSTSRRTRRQQSALCAAGMSGSLKGLALGLATRGAGGLSEGLELGPRRRNRTRPEAAEPSGELERARAEIAFLSLPYRFASGGPAPEDARLWAGDLGDARGRLREAEEALRLEAARAEHYARLAGALHADELRMRRKASGTAFQQRGGGPATDDALALARHYATVAGALERALRQALLAAAVPPALAPPSRPSAGRAGAGKQGRRGWIRAWLCRLVWRNGGGATQVQAAAAAATQEAGDEGISGGAA